MRTQSGELRLRTNYYQKTDQTSAPLAPLAPLAPPGLAATSYNKTQ